MIDLIVVTFAFALIWIVFAVVQDLKHREIANWLNFSLVIFALAFKVFYSIFSDDYKFLMFGVVGLAVFFVLGHILYYARFFAGGDAKLFIALGAVLPFTADLKDNFLVCMVFLFGLFLFGGIYSIIYSGFLAYFNRKEFNIEFKKKFIKNEKWFFIAFIFCLFFVVLGFVFSELILFILGCFCFLIPISFVYVSAVEKTCLIKEIDVEKITVGDWLVDSIQVKEKTIKPDWEGISEEDLNFIKKHYKNKVLVKYGIPFSPAFLLALLFLIILYYLRYPYWIFR